MLLTLIPLLLIITTYLDYYSPEKFSGRSNQIENPFMLASLSISVILVVISFIYSVYTYYRMREEKPVQAKRSKDIQQHWEDLVDEEWRNEKVIENFRRVLPWNLVEKEERVMVERERGDGQHS